MEHHALRKYRGPETWAKVKKAYLAGEPARSVARRFDVGLANLRKKARAEGWTRDAWAKANDLKPVRGASDGPEWPTEIVAEPEAADPLRPDITDTAVITAAALERALSALIGERPQEAQAHIKAGLAAGELAEVVSGLRRMRAAERALSD